MPRQSNDFQLTAEKGRDFVSAELRRRGADVKEVKVGRLRFLEATFGNGGRSTQLRVKTRRSGTWQVQASTGSAQIPAAPLPTFWVFVDLSRQRPEFFIAPDNWVRQDIFAAHSAYLKKHGGHRAETDTSDHHAIQLDRIEQWRGRWDQLGLPADGAAPSV